MPLLNSTIIKLNEITLAIKNKDQLTSDDESIIKQIFKEINENGEMYDVDEPLCKHMRKTNIVSIYG